MFTLPIPFYSYFILLGEAKDTNNGNNAASGSGKDRLIKAIEYGKFKISTFKITFFFHSQKCFSKYILYFLPGKTDEIKSLINNGADVNARGSQGDAPIHVAILAGKFTSLYT